MVKCVKCGAQLKAEDCFCDICGAKQKKEKKCECGFILEEFFAFCPMCGKSLAKEESRNHKTAKRRKESDNGEKFSAVLESLLGRKK